jgi:extracellular factor (EF) 3-hydroxypalmitic acid methyl ester biosynthesis protein
MVISPSAASELSGAPEPRLAVRLERDGEVRRAEVTAASRISLWVAFDGPPPPHRAEFERVIVSADGREQVLTRCRFLEERAPQGFAGRLLFLDDIFDCRALLYESKLVNLKAFFHNLPLVLSQKDRIRPEFQAHVARTLFDLGVFKRFFDEQDRILAGEPPGVAQAAHDALIRTEGATFKRHLDGIVRELEQVVRGYTQEEHERHGFYLRRAVWPFIIGSEIHKRTNLKPRGYAGDAEMMRLIYENAHVGRYVFNQLLHKHAVEMPSAEAVRLRRRYVPEVLREIRARFPEARPFRFLSIASGPAWELQDIFTAAADVERLACVLLDQDPEALDAAREQAARIEGALGARPNVEYVNDSVRTMLRTRDLAGRLGRCELVYSMGLFDYLTPPVARAVLAKAYELVRPGGALLVGNYHVDNPGRVYMDYWMDWPLYYRTEQSMLELAAGLGGRATVTLDQTRCQLFLRLEREP